MTTYTPAAGATMNETAERLLRVAIDSAINQAERDLKTLSDLIKNGKLGGKAISYFEQQETDTLDAIRQMKMHRVALAKTGGAA